MSNSNAAPTPILLGPGPEEEAFVDRATRLEKEVEKRTCLENAWFKVRDWSTPSERNDYFCFALAIHGLVESLSKQGLADRLDNLIPGSNAKCDAQRIYQALRDRNNVGLIAEQLEDVQRQAEGTRGGRASKLLFQFLRQRV